MKWHWIVLIFILLALNVGLISYFLIAAKQQETNQHIFCEKCCWKHSYIYTCAENEKDLWKRIP